VQHQKTNRFVPLLLTSIQYIVEINIWERHKLIIRYIQKQYFVIAIMENNCNTINEIIKYIRWRINLFEFPNTFHPQRDQRKHENLGYGHVRASPKNMGNPADYPTDAYLNKWKFWT
jgi:hypothetical protein